jgi:DNA-binding NarL/FixJ family response regulator
VASPQDPHPIRVLVGPLPPLVDEIVRQALAGHADIELIGPADQEREALRAIAEWCPDVVIVPVATEGTAAAYQAAMPRYPSVRLLQIGGRFVNIYEVRLLAANAGLEAVVQAIRAVA